MTFNHPPRHRSRVGGLVLAVALLASGHAFAGPAEAARAEKLFQDALYLMDGGSVAPACLKLVESQRLVPAVGTLLALADCHAKEGKTATAWGEFTELAQTTSAPEFVAEAQRRADELYPKLSYVSVRATGAAEGLEVRFDDSTLGEGALDTELPTDPGQHLVHATAPGYEEVTIRVTVGLGPARQVVSIPPLRERATEDSMALPPQHGSVNDARMAPSTTGYWVGGAGLALVAVGTVFGVLSLGQNSDLKSNGCFDSPDPDFDCAAAQSSRDRDAWIATGGVGLGLVGVAIGGWMVLSGSDDDSPDEMALGSLSRRPPGWYVSFRPTVETSERGVLGAGAALQGTF